MKIAIVGGPSSGKTVLAHGLIEALKLRHIPAVFAGEAATKFILTCGVPQDIADQHTIVRWQREEEENVPENSVVVCDCATFLTYIYALRVKPPSDSASKIRHNFYLKLVHRLWRDSIQSYDYIFFTPLEHGYRQDGVRYQKNEEEAQEIGRQIKGFLQSELIPFYEVSGTQEERKKKILDILIRDLPQIA
jgi:nicotinamide riboside kinase